MQTVVYNVSGNGRAINITYVDNGGVLQTEFNVRLPWSKEVSLAESGSRTPNVTIINIGHEVTCSVSMDGVEINQRSGIGLTICNGSARPAQSTRRGSCGARTIRRPAIREPCTTHSPPIPARRCRKRR